MKISKILVAVVAVFSIANADKFSDISSNSDIFKKHLKEIRSMERSIDNSSGRAGAELTKLFIWETLPGAFREIIAVDDEDGFASMLEVMKRLGINLTNFSEDSFMYNFAVDIVKKNAVKCMKLLTETNFDFKNEYFDRENNKSLSLLNLAKELKADKEMIDILESKR